jgi:hypothetical protein
MFLITEPYPNLGSFKMIPVEFRIEDAQLKEEIWRAGHFYGVLLLQRADFRLDPVTNEDH